jgi:prephenate dehydratase
MKIVVLGAPGSYTEEASKSYAKKLDIPNDPTFEETIEEVFKSVSLKSGCLGIVPIANSVGGIVEESLEMMSKYYFDIVEIFSLPIAHNLLTLPENKKSDIKLIVSHSQALAQCRLYLARNWLKTKKSRYASTAGAARDLATGKLPKNGAVIGSKKAALLYGLKIIDENIQDSRFNFTQFLIFKNAVRVSKPSIRRTPTNKLKY